MDLIAIEKSRDQIFEIVENTRSETDRLREELAQIKASVTYDKAGELQANLASLHEREKQLKLRRDELERSLKKLEQTINKAENLITQIGVVFEHLEGNMKDLHKQLGKALQQRQLAPKIIETQEEERRRIAREIHDGPAQSMANIVLRAEICGKMLGNERPEVRQELSVLKDSARKSLQEVRRIIFDLRPMGLDDLGLYAAVTRYIENFKGRHTEYEIESKFVGSRQRLDSLVEVALYRIIQEAMQNIVKHAQAKKIKVVIENDKKQLTVRVIDDGKGFAVGKNFQQPNRENYGLLGMKERMEAIGGRLNILSEEGKGTEVLAVLPLDQ